MPPTTSETSRWSAALRGMECSKTFCLAFAGLILMTAGFFLTMAGWFAPPINQSVYRVRLAGPLALLFGLILLISSCLLCAVHQGRCCAQCIQLYQVHKSVLRSKFDHPDHCHMTHNHHKAQEAEYVFETPDHQVHGYQAGRECGGRPATLIIRETPPSYFANQSACEFEDSPRPRKKKKRSRRAETGRDQQESSMVSHPSMQPRSPLLMPQVQKCQEASCSCQATSFANHHATSPPSSPTKASAFRSPEPRSPRSPSTAVRVHHSPRNNSHGRDASFQTLVLQSPRHTRTPLLLTTSHEVSSTSGESYSQRPSPLEMQSDV